VFSGVASHVVEVFDSFIVGDKVAARARLNYQYYVHAWKEEQARRLYDFLAKHDRFTRGQLRCWLYRELYLLRHRRKRWWESRFVWRVLWHILEELEFMGYVRPVDGFWLVLQRPSLDECRRILGLQVYECYR